MSQARAPNDLRLAAEAYDKALSSLPAEAYERQPYEARRLIAIHVIDAALSGERDPVRLRDGVLEYVRSTVTKGTARWAELLQRASAGANGSCAAASTKS
jgi:hypothetical protein